jgi:hypothetical protein
MAIDVAVTTKCDRCKRKEQVTISSDKVAEYEALQEAEKAHQQAVIDFVASTQEADRHKLPDLVVIFKGKVQMLSNVCDAYCAKTVQNSLDVLFREAKPRKPRKKREDTKDAPKDAPKDAKDKKGGKAA